MERTQVLARATERGLEVEPLEPNHQLRTTCRACGFNVFDRVLDMGDQYLVRFNETPDLSGPRAPLILVRCRGCGLLQLGNTTKPALLYDRFWYRSSMNATMRACLSELVQDTLGRGPYDGTWLDIGANDGYLLSQVPFRFRRVACEPAKNFTDELKSIAQVVIADYFSAEMVLAAAGTCDVITSAAMFYDLDDPGAFVADIARVLAPDGIWVNQLNDSPTMIRRTAFDSICHEHLCYYDVHTLASLYSKHGLVITNISYNEVNGGSIRVTAQRAMAATHAVTLAEHPRVTEASAREFGHRSIRWAQTMGEMLTNISGPIWGYGASTKGCALLQFLGESAGQIRGIADKNPEKHGRYISGSNIRVTSEEEMRESAPAWLMVLPWAFRDEFVERERALRESGTRMIFPLPSIEIVL